MNTFILIYHVDVSSTRTRWRQRYNSNKSSQSTQLARKVSPGPELLLFSGIAELIFIIALTVVGERESPQMHVVFFSSFIAGCALYFMMISRSSGSKIKRRIRAMFTVIFYCLIVIISTSFFLNLNFCVKHGNYSQINTNQEV